MRLIRMGRKQGVLEVPTNSKEDTGPVKNPKRNLVVIDVLCKKYTMLFASDFNPAQKIVEDASKPRVVKEKKSRSTKSKSKSLEGAAPAPGADVEKSTETSENVIAPPGNKEESSANKVNKHSKKTEVLGAHNVIDSPKSSKSTRDNKREKRKRFTAEDNDISAENIPLEAVLPKLQFGINNDICPKKRRRLQSLLSPKSPSPSQFFSEKHDRFFK